MSTLWGQLMQAERRAEQERIVSRALRAKLATPSHQPIAPRSAEDDSQRLRGIPAIGRNVAGAVPGTDPSKLYEDD